MTPNPAETTAAAALADLAALGAAAGRAEARLVGLGHDLRRAAATAPVTTTAMPSPGGVALRVLLAAAALLLAI